MDDIGRLRKDLNKRRKHIDSELAKLEKSLSKVTGKPKVVVKKPVVKKPIPQKIVPEPEPIKPVIKEKIETYVPERKSLFESLPSFPVPNKKILAGSALLVLIILFAITISFVLTRTVTRDEFVSRVQGCESATYLGQVDNSLVKYSTKNCQVIKEITHIGDQEPQEVRLLFEGKKMTCKYRAGEFNYDDIDYFMNGIDSCWGDLKDILLELQGFKLARERTV
ncbi:hypothetical protein KY312_02540 [Candidatus Woesearchaeota archaeon]|nr:hypothetical protein [Candidatus Woesearchaeota archaeon]